jgi:hypothetical protein
LSIRKRCAGFRKSKKTSGRFLKVLKLNKKKGFSAREWKSKGGFLNAGFEMHMEIVVTKCL